MLIDTHAHLTDTRYNGSREIIDGMKADGLEKIISVGFDMPSSIGSLEFAERNEDIYCAVGFHPSEVGKIEDGDCERLLEVSHNPKCVAIGEIGLDYYYPDTDKPLQKKGLEQMFKLVNDSALPAIFHIRDAYEDMYNAVRANRDCFKASGVVHCFSGSRETALQYIDMGFYISFTGSITFKNAVKFPDIIRALPIDRILVETDCPYLTPTPFRGQLNYPKYVRYQAAKLAEILSKDEEEIARITTDNAYRLFTKLKRG